MFRLPLVFNKKYLSLINGRQLELAMVYSGYRLPPTIESCDSEPLFNEPGYSQIIRTELIQKKTLMFNPPIFFIECNTQNTYATYNTLVMDQDVTKQMAVMKY